LSREIELKRLPKRARVAPSEASTTALQQDNQGVRLTSNLLCADGRESAMYFYHLVADVLSSIAAAEPLARAA